jgi:hypothetical protein
LKLFENALQVFSNSQKCFLCFIKLVLVSKIYNLGTNFLMKFKESFKSLAFIYCMTEQNIIRLRNLSFGEKNAPQGLFALILPFHLKGWPPLI